ncbi:DoxX family protein [Nonomuraea sediminis]|uniref:DoxX family protein n=1 Tax=Nonomuraea sediminis TaxID=2835864 RepID=UPI001BDC80E1|nr:DoxX family protein [Nonomuraea sediminis]
MEPLITLLAVTALTLAVGVAARKPSLRRLPVALRGGLAAMFALTATVHFAFMRAELVAMVPPWLPAPELLVTMTGVAELAGAVGLLLPATAGWAAGGLTLLLVALYPANVHLALSGQDLPWWDQLPERTLMQLIFLAATTTVLIDRIRARTSATRTASKPANAA